MLYKVIVDGFPLSGEWELYEAERKKANLKHCLACEIEIVPVEEVPHAADHQSERIPTNAE